MLRACNAGLSCGQAKAVYLCSYYRGQLRKIGENSNSNTCGFSRSRRRAKEGGGGWGGEKSSLYQGGFLSFEVNPDY